MKTPVILASQSPRRKQLLEWAEVEFSVVVADTDESFPETLSCAEIAIHIAKNKALAVLEKIDGGSTIIAADTIVVCENKIIGKPKDREDAINIISQLSGKTHEVITGVYIHKPDQVIAFSDMTKVSFYELTQAQIEFYVDKYKPYDKAGAYAIQEWIGVVGISSIVGDFYNVMGLPVSKVIRHL
jgi:septum formation protein